MAIVNNVIGILVGQHHSSDSDSFKAFGFSNYSLHSTGPRSFGSAINNSRLIVDNFSSHINVTTAQSIIGVGFLNDSFSFTGAGFILTRIDNRISKRFNLTDFTNILSSGVFSKTYWLRNQGVFPDNGNFLNDTDLNKVVYYRLFQSDGTTPINIFDSFDDSEVGRIEQSNEWVRVVNESHAIGKVYLGTNSTPYWQQGATPTITSFTVAPTTIDLDTRPSGNITLSFGVTGSTHNAIHRKDTGQNIPLTTPTTAVIAQPDKPTTYVLLSSNNTGAVSREVTVDVNKNAGITNFRRTGFYQSRFGTSSGTYRFGARITGLPQPVLTYRFSTGEQGSITTRHLTRVDDNTWDLTWTIYLGSLVSRSMTLTATNASNTTSATIANINN